MDTDSLTGLPTGRAIEPITAGWPDAKRLVGRYVTLEALNPDLHGAGLWEVAGGLESAALWQYMSEGPFADRAAFDDSLGNSVAHEDPVFYAIIDNPTDRPVGRCALLNIRPKHGVVEVGHLLFGPPLQRSSGATEALYLLAKYVFDELGYRRYEWKCNALNAKSRRAAERFGFMFEGIFRQHMIVKNRNRDSAWFSMLDGEWPAIKRALEAWLSPENFDSAGNQRRRLGELGQIGR